MHIIETEVEVDKPHYCVLQDYIRMCSWVCSPCIYMYQYSTIDQSHTSSIYLRVSQIMIMRTNQIYKKAQQIGIKMFSDF